MAFLRKVLLLAAVASPVASEVDCAAAGSCPDETSLMQMKQVLKHADERIPSDGPVHDDEALIKGLSTKGEKLDAALETNKDKIRAKIESKAADDIDFEDKTLRKQRKLQKAADDKVAEIKADYKKSVAHEDDKVIATQAKRDAVEAAAEKRVKDAKADAEAKYLKKEDAEDVAAYGRQIGEKEGDDASTHAWAEYEQDYENNQDKKQRKEERAAIKKQTAEERAAMADDKDFKEELDSYVNREKEEARIAKADAAANAHAEEYDVAGPEGIDNKVTSLDADMDAKSYERHAANSESTIEKAAAAEYPAGDWPVGPGDGPLAASERASS